ncbi:hypothetical protein CDD82_709 [Ophiocordyceps australis]|uniref:Uncharacterized protein n=1 Tax=Ophiocordyceps australis TaxID=1399860 RepID=A0A2C5YKU6_9HYPO|nr:hypothetical protein CDD82_709 [Ophiocordyceps australis]
MYPTAPTTATTMPRNARSLCPEPATDAAGGACRGGVTALPVASCPHVLCHASVSNLAWSVVETACCVVADPVRNPTAHPSHVCRVLVSPHFSYSFKTLVSPLLPLCSNHTPAKKPTSTIVHGQSVTVKVVARVTVMVLLPPIRTMVASGQYVVNPVTTRVVVRAAVWLRPSAAAMLAAAAKNMALLTILILLLLSVALETSKQFQY